MKWFYKSFLVAALTALSGFHVGASEGDVPTVPYLVVETASGVKEIRISSDLVLTPENGNLIVESYNQDPSYVDIALDIAEIRHLGVAYFPDSLTGVAFSPLMEADEDWTIYDMNGIIVSSGKSGAPSLEGLKPDKAYIVRAGSRSFKYIPIR